MAETTITIEGRIVGLGAPETFPANRPQQWFHQATDGTVTIKDDRIRAMALAAREKGPACSDTEFVADVIWRILEASDAGKLTRE